MGPSTHKPKRDQLVVWLRAVQVTLAIALALAVAGVVLSDAPHITFVVASIVVVLSLIAVTRAIGLAATHGMRRLEQQAYQRRATDRQ